MVTANMITFPKDPNVIIPIASDAKVPTLVEGRVVMNIYEDGTLKNTAGKVLSLAELSQVMSQAKAKEPNTRLHLRAHKKVPYRHIKEVSRASAEGGVATVIFSTYQVGN